jgi:hypothetical protein
MREVEGFLLVMALFDFLLGGFGLDRCAYIMVFLAIVDFIFIIS